jgi:aspartate aminotransferase
VIQPGVSITWESNVKFTHRLDHPANHYAIFKNVGISPFSYPYYSPSTISLDFSAFLSSLSAAEPRSVFLLHACAHNPTGVDPTQEQWKEIAKVMKRKGHYAFFDCAYQGFASGDLEKDAWAIRYFLESGVSMLVCQVFFKKRIWLVWDCRSNLDVQSFAKNAGLYGERVGALHVIAQTTEAANRIKSQLSVLQRSEISNPPSYGARIASPKLIPCPTSCWSIFRSRSS